VRRLRALSELLLFELRADRVVYLGPDDALDRAMAGWAGSLGAPTNDEEFLREAALLGAEGTAESIEALLERDARRHRLRDLVALPGIYARGVELLEDGVLLVVFDRSVLDEDDIANAQVVAYGHASAPDLRVIGPRAFVTPGYAIAPTGVSVALVDETAAGLALTLHDQDGAETQRAALPRRRSVKVEVQG
jgi:hypothetical protein